MQRHWTFLETEESIKKLEERKKLEGCLKEFLCLVSHDRKFFLPETGQVLRKTVCGLNEFTAQNAIVGFEAISQYANNLFTKPWRKEFRMLKTYSGSYQHEVESNLIDADKLFLAMGYHRIAEDTFVLEGPICPDQVTNVSRDAMTAYVECQIMKHIYAGLSAAGFTCSWQDIFHYRERHVGGVTQTIKEMAYRLHEKRLRKEQQQQLLNTAENTYSNLTTEKSGQPSPCALHGHANNNPNPNSNPNSCALHHSANQSTVPPTNLNCMYQQPQGALMTHSRSLEHYQEPHASLPHRHSFDQHPKDCAALHPHGHLYEAPYDCLDGLSMGSSASYAAVAGAYNAPGNRYPLPYNISSQLNAQYATPLDGYANAEHNNANMYATIGKPTTATVPHSCGYHGGNQVATSSRQAANVAAMAAMQHRQSTYPPDHHLIDFDERAQLMQHDFNDPRLYEPRRGQSNMPRSQGVKHSMNTGVYAPPRDAVPLSYASYDLPTTLPQPSPQDMYVYARPVPKSSRIRAQLETGELSTLDRQPRHRDQLMDPMDNNRKTTHKELRDRISLTAGAVDGRHHVRERDMNISDTASYESPSLDDYTMLNSASPPLIPKVQEGVGSFESWNYVFKNLERSGYSKDLGDREDLLVQSLDLDSLTLANGGNAAVVEKRRPETHSQPQANVEKSRTLERKRETRVVQAPPPAPLTNSSSAGVKKVKSALKTASVDNRASGSQGRTGTGRSRNSTTGAVAKQPPPVSTQLIVTSPNEWSCRFCTFLNPDTKRICEMCCRSKDFNLEAAANVSQHAASSTCV